jgi:hypothetical protein
MAVNTTSFPARGSRAHSSTGRKASGQNSSQRPTDDEILGLVTAVPGNAGNAGTGSESEDSTEDANSPGETNSAVAAAQEAPDVTSAGSPPGATPTPPELAAIFAAHPELRAAWEAAQAYQSVFATPAAARDARQQLEELDAMFFSARPGDHAALAARIHELSPEAFQGLAQAMQAHAAKSGGVRAGVSPASAASNGGVASLAQAEASGGTQTGEFSVGAAPSVAATSHSPSPNATQSAPAAAVVAPAHAAELHPAIDPQRAAQAAFFHDTNAAAVEQILGAIHSQVDRLLPDSITANTRNRIVGEIYRELDATLRANRQLGKQLREAFHSRARDAAHQRAIVTLVAGRARQALPAVAKRVIGEWTHSILAANHDRLGRHEAASKRVDISGAGSSDGVNRKPISPRDINYRKLSDADILNL